MDHEHSPQSKSEVRVIASSRNWIVGEAVSQLNRVARLPGVRLAVGMPDLHPGRAAPIGAAVISEGVMYPLLAGNDIGCGMALWQAELPARKVKLDRWVKKLRGLESRWDGDSASWLDQEGLAQTPFDASLGTIGGGNHFAELQAVESVDDPGAFARLGLNADRLVLLVHSGSRGLGEAVLRQHVERFGADGVPEASDGAQRYLVEHDHASAWARGNRALIACRFLSLLGSEGKPVVDLCHNSITPQAIDGRRCWLHRKGAAPANAGPVVIPGSRGTLSYLVEPVGEQAATGFSVAHGAGRKWARSDALARLDKRYTAEKLRRTAFGGHVICDDKDLLYEEAPQAYKDIDVVIESLVECGLVRVVAKFRPLITYKTRKVD